MPFSKNYHNKYYLLKVGGGGLSKNIFSKGMKYSTKGMGPNQDTIHKEHEIVVDVEFIQNC